MALEMKYFVLKPYTTSTHPDKVAHVIASRKAMLEYARVIESTDKGLARSLRNWVKRATKGYLT